MPSARFLGPAIKTSVPIPTKKIPVSSTMCGGLTICTSNPKESCHQLSKGAEIIMVAPPQAARNAPKGPRNPHTRTEASRAVASAANVVCRIKYPQESAASKAPNWIARCAGVQNVSRPMVMCQEMSQYSPKTMEVMAPAPANKGQGTQAVEVCAGADAEIGRAVLWAISPPNTQETLSSMLRLTKKQSFAKIKTSAVR